MRHNESLINDLRTLLATTFGVEESELPAELSQATCRQWTSLKHMLLMVAIEEEFDITLSLPEMTAMTSQGAIVSVLTRRAAAAA